MARPRKLPAGMAKRGDTYYSAFRAGGRLVRKRLSSDFKAACEILNDLKARADRADFKLFDNDYSWTTLKAEYLKWKRQTSRNPDQCESDLGQFEKFCPIRSVRQIDSSYIVGFRDHRIGEGVTPRTVNKQVGGLRAMLNWAVAGKRIGSNPIAGIKPLPHDNPTKQRRALTTEEARAIFDASPDHLRPIWRAFMCTGIRKDELVSLLFSDFDKEGRVLTIRAEVAKNHKAREVPLDDETFATIVRLRDAAKHRRPVEGWTPKATDQQAANFSKTHIFVTKANTPWRNNLLTRFYAVCKRAGIEDGKRGGSIDLHSLRVTFTTLSLENGASPKAVQAILGHSTLSLTMDVYAKATERAKREAVNALPFATSSAPAHIVSVQNVPKVCASNPETLQVVSA
jgi:integrase